MQYVSEVVMGAPYTVTDSMMDQCKVQLVVGGVSNNCPAPFLYSVTLLYMAAHQCWKIQMEMIHTR